MTKTESVVRTMNLNVDRSTLYTTPHGNSYYLKANNVDQTFIDSGVLPVVTISSDELVSRNQQIAMKSPPAIANKMMQEASVSSYSSFTGITRNILSGRIPANSVSSTNDDLFNSTHRATWVASSDSSDVDYLGQDEETESYGDKIAAGARTVIDSSWFTIVQFYGHYFDQDSMNEMAGFKSSGYGLHGALVRPVGEHFLLGAYLGWQNLSADIRHSDGEIEASTWRIGPTFAWGSGPAHAEGILTYNWHKLTPKVGSTSSEFKSRQWDTYLRGGLDIDLENVARGMTLTPELQLLYSSQSRDAFDWVYNQKIQGADSKGWVTRVGGTLGYDRLQFEQPLELKLSLGWQYNQFSTADLVTGDNQVGGLGEYDKHGMYYSAGVDTRVNETFNVSLSYAGLWSGNALGHYLKAGMEFRF